MTVKTRQTKEQLFNKADAGDADAMYSLGYRYMEGIGGLPKDQNKAVEWFTKSAQAGSRNAVVMIKKLPPEQPKSSPTSLEIPYTPSYSYAPPVYEEKSSAALLVILFMLMLPVIGVTFWINAKWKKEKESAEKEIEKEKALKKKQAEQEIKNLEIEAINEQIRAINSYIVFTIKSHIETLSLKRKKMVRADDYGNVFDDKWQREIEYFIEHVIGKEQGLKTLLEIDDKFNKNKQLLENAKNSQEPAFEIWRRCPKRSDIREKIIRAVAEYDALEKENGALSGFEDIDVERLSGLNDELELNEQINQTAKIENSESNLIANEVKPCQFEEAKHKNDVLELNEQQRKAATYSGNAKNILVTAGAGCGKTKTIIARAVNLVRLGTDASKILMLTFTNRAAREMKTRLTSEIGPLSDQIQAGTFHSFCLKVMAKMPKSFGISGLNIIDSDDQDSLMTIVRAKYIKKQDKDLNKEFPKSSQLINYYSYSRNTCQRPDLYLSEQTDLNSDFIKICCDIFVEYQKAKEIRGYLDYDDLLQRFTISLDSKPDLRKSVTNLFDEVLVDEMQDTNPLQFGILKHFSKENVRLFCVGDPAQSIYRFRGAEFKHVYDFDKNFGNSTTITLSLNYRSYQEILNLSNWLLQKSSKYNYKNKLDSNRGKSGFLPALTDFDDSYRESEWVSDKIIEKNELGIPYKEIMVLVRSGFDAKPIEAEFIRRGIPYYFIGGTSLIKAAHVRDVLSLLRIARNSKDDLAWMRYLRLWPRIGEKTAEKIINDFYENPERPVIKILSESLGTAHKAVLAYEQVASTQNKPKLCVSNAISSMEQILQERYDKWNVRSQDLKLLLTVSEKYEAISDLIDAFTLEPLTSSEIDKSENTDAVLLITVHSAKGTEASICFVVNAKQGTYPHSRSFGDIEAEEEERRVLYVALTRAKNELYITRSSESNSGFYVQNKPTVGEEYFLSEVPDKFVSKNIIGWKPNGSRNTSSLKDVY